MSGETRVYLPLRPEQVSAVGDGASLDAGLRGFAVTGQIRAAVAGDDTEHMEFLALQQAAAFADSHGMAIVIGAADVASGSVCEVDPGGGEPTVEVSAPVEAARFASFHLDDHALGRAQPSGGAAGMQHTNDTDGIELSWYDVSEVAQVLRHLSPPE